MRWKSSRRQFESRKGSEMFRLRLSEFLDKLVLLCAMLLFAWVGIRAIFEVRQLDSIAGQSRPLLSELTVNAPRHEATAPEEGEEVWAAPESQSRGEEWVFDVFTPPVIYYDPNSREFAVTPPSQQQVVDDGEAQWAAFELDLIEVRLRPYKLQLVGYAGEDGSYVAYFESVSTGGLLLLREGQENPDLGVKLLSFQEQRIRSSNESATPVVQTIGVARLLDRASGQEISLTNVETKMFSDLEARLRVRSTGAILSAQAGRTLELADGDYLIEDLSVEPQAAMITKISKDGTRRFSKTLTPVALQGSQPRDATPETVPVSPFAIRPGQNSGKPNG